MQSYPPTSTCVELPLYGDNPIYICVYKGVNEMQGAYMSSSLQRIRLLGHSTLMSAAQDAALHNSRCRKGDMGLGLIKAHHGSSAVTRDEPCGWGQFVGALCPVMG